MANWLAVPAWPAVINLKKSLLGVTEMSLKRIWKVSAGEVKLGGMPTDIHRLALLLRASLFHITHDFTIMTLFKNFCTRH